MRNKKRKLSDTHIGITHLKIMQETYFRLSVGTMVPAKVQEKFLHFTDDL